MGCACSKGRANTRQVAETLSYDPDKFPATDSSGPWKVFSSGGAAYRFATLADAKVAAEMIDGRIVSA